MQKLKQSFSPNQFLTVGLLSGLTIGLLNTQPVQASSLELTFLDQAIQGATFTIRLPL